MQSKDVISKQFEYNYWANGRIFEKAVLVSSEEMQAASVIEGRSLQQVLSHMVYVEKVWRLLARDGKFDRSQMPSDEQLATAEGIRQFAGQEEQEMQAFLKNLTEDELAEQMIITRWDGVKVSMTRWNMLIHLATHSMQHRTEAAVLLTQYGQSPGDLDFLFFVL